MSFINKDTRDCRRNNLSIKSPSGTELDWPKSTKTPKFIGVRWDMFFGMWEAYFHDFHIGFYLYEIEAAKAFNDAITKAAKSKVILNDLDFINE